MFRKVSIGSLLVGTYLFSVPVFSYSEDMGLNFIPQAIGALIVVYAIYIIMSKSQFYTNNSIYFYGIYCIWTIIVSFFVVYQVNTDSILTLLKIGIIALSISFLINKESDLNLTLFIYFISIFITIYLNLDDIIALRGAGQLDEDMRFDGTFENANTAAIFALTIIWAGVFLLVSERQNTLVKILIFLGIFLAGFLIFYSGSRKGILGILILSMSFSFLIYRHYGQTFAARAMVILAVIGGLVLLSFVLVTSPFFNRMTGMLTGDESSFTLRQYLIRESLRVWSDSPKNFMIGIGFGNFHYYNYARLYSHTSFTETLVTTGLIGFILFFSALGSICILYYRLYKNRAGKQKLVAQSIIVLLILILFFNAFAVMIADRILWPLIAYLYSYGMILKNGPLHQSKVKLRE